MLFFDADEAGTDATLLNLAKALRGIEHLYFMSENVDDRFVRYESMPTAQLRVALLPPGCDPDDVLRRTPHLAALALQCALTPIQYARLVLSTRVEKMRTTLQATQMQKTIEQFRDFAHEFYPTTEFDELSLFFRDVYRRRDEAQVS